MVIGVGNALRGDDAAGLEVARRVRGDDQIPAAVMQFEGEGAGLLELWDGADAVVLIDAVVTGAEPGTLHRIDAGHGPVTLPPRSQSTHATSVADAIELARALGRLPATVVLVGIEAARFELGAGLSDGVAAAIDAAVAAVHAEVRRL